MGIDLNWEAVKSFVSDVEVKDKISAKEKADVAAQKVKAEIAVIRNTIGADNSTTTEIKTVETKNYPKEKPSNPSHGQSYTSIQRKEKEELEDIVEDISSCAKARRGSGISPVGRVYCLRDGYGVVYWFTNEEHHYSIFQEHPELKKFGQFVRKNSDIAVRIQTTDIGTSFKFPHINNIKRTVWSEVYLENRSDFQNKTISIAGDSMLYQYRDIDEFLAALRQNREEIAKIESTIKELAQQNEELKKHKGTAQEQAKRTRSITEYKRQYRILTEQQEDLKNITIYIRKQGEMRYSLLVDPVQTRIKTQNLFDGKTLIIDGGPGTGKSTTMIHRLAYLTDIYAIDEDERNKTQKYHLNSPQRERLRQAIATQRDWMFFSPSRLLKEYLSDAMRKEGLKNTSQKVWNWKDYRELILQENYILLGQDSSKAPFRVCHETAPLFYQNSDIIGEFESFYLGQLREIKEKLPQIDAEGTAFAWTAIARNIRKRIEEESETYSIVRFVNLFNSLESVYGSDCKELLRQKDALVGDLAHKICGLLEEKEDVRSEIEDILDLASEEEDTIDDEEEVEIEKAERNVPVKKSSSGILAWLKSLGGNNAKENERDNEDRLVKEIQKWLKAFCNSKYLQLSDVHQMMSDEILPLIGDSYDKQISRIGELMVFEQFAQYTRGVKTIMLNGLSARYKKFRAHLMKTQFGGCDLRLLRIIMQRSQGRELHHQEQSLLLGFVNNLVKQTLSANIPNIKHNFIDAFNEVARPIIGIDEATDFSTCDIYAMQSLLSRDFCSLTLCGDMMQRLTPYGIKSWEELDGIVSNPKVEQMKTSYRQSKKLLEVARRLSIDTLGDTPNYRAFITSSKVPAPLVYVSENETFKIEWISKRIAEVFRAYGELLPSIAIFVNDKGNVAHFVENLQKTEFFTKNGVKVLDGSKSTTDITESHICVYPIDIVKGMEFDVVFFHDIDHSSEDMDMLKRFIYVGISRAAFFLGITLSEDIPEISKFFESNKDWFKI